MHVAGDSNTVVAHRNLDLIANLRRSQGDGPPGGVYFAALSSRF
jgi:hypothetical protein